MTIMKINLNIILIIALFITATGSALATNDGKGNNYLKRNVGIKERKPQAELHINGSLIMNDDNEATDNILRSDANGLASWVPIGAIPGIVANNGTVVNISLFNGFLQDAYLNGTTTIDGRLYFPAGFANGLILTMHANGNAHWEVNNGATIAVGNGEWLELANVLYPGDMTGAQNVAIGSQNPASADTILYKNGAAHFNKQKNPDGDFIVSSTNNQHMLFVDASEDQVGINIGDPDTTLDVKGHFSIRSGTAGAGSTDKDFLTTPDPFSAVFWLAENSVLGAGNGDLMARINANGQDKIFTVIDFDGTTNGETAQNGLILTDLTPNRLVSTDASKKLISETNIIIDGNGYVGIGVASPDSQLEIGDGIRDFIDGVMDLHVADDIEADGTVYGATFVGDGSGLELNGNTIRNAKIYTSRIYGTLDFNGASMIRAGFGPLLINGDTEFAGNAIMQAGYEFRLLAGPIGSEYSAFYSHNGAIGINTENPLADFDINGQFIYRDGTPAAGKVLTSDTNGLASWQYLDTENAAYAINTGNATTANFADNMINGTILNSNFTNGTINGSTLINVTILSGTGLSEWTDGVDGLHPKDAAGAQNVLVGGTTLATSTISLESNGKVTAVKFVGDGTGITGAGTNVWADQGTYLHPGDLSGAETVIIGSNIIATADIIIGDSGYLVVNERNQDSDFRIEGITQQYLFFTDASTDRVGIRTSSPRTDLDINGSLAFTTHTVDITAGAGIPGVIVNRNTIVYMRNSGNACSIDITANPQIAAGVDGQIITLVGTYTNEEVFLEDGDGLALNTNVSFTLRAKDSITFIYSSTFGEWVEVSRNNYTERSGENITRGACI
jgi:hypothetical protein